MDYIVQLVTKTQTRLSDFHFHFGTLRIVAHQVPLFMGFSRQDYWSGLSFHPPRNHPNPGIEPTSPALQAHSLPLSHQGSTPAQIGSVSCSVLSDSLQPHGVQPVRLLCPWNSPGKNTGLGRHSRLQEIIPTQGLNPDLPHCRQILYCLNHQGTPV